MSKLILERLDELEQELNVLEKYLVEKRGSNHTNNSQLAHENEELEAQLKVSQQKNRRAGEIISRNIIKLEKLLEREERSNA